MRGNLVRTLPVFFCASACAIASASTTPSLPTVRNCHDGFTNWIKKNPEPEGRPLRLVSIDCVGISTDSLAVTSVSPDATTVEGWSSGYTQHFNIAPLGQPGLIRVPNKVTFRTVASGYASPSAPDAITWSGDSDSLWSVRQDVNPSGFATSGLTPIKVDRNGSIHQLPPLGHPAGPLDGLMWIGGEGKALALFGWRGGSYKPEHIDPNPTMAIVDASTGRILDTLPARNIPTFKQTRPAYGFANSIGSASGAILRDGRARVVFRMNRWIERPRSGSQKPADFIRHAGFWLEWTQGESPQEWRDSAPHDWATPAVLSSDGSKMLVIRTLQPDGVQVFDCDECKVPPPTPVTGPIAELIDVVTRRVLWSVPATASQFWPQRAAPAMSGDGRFALVELPPSGMRRGIGLIDMRDGKVIQTIAPSMIGSYPDKFGFTQDSKRVWVATSGIVRFYSFD